MPCPFFEPQVVASSTFSRLPLLDEYHGVCHATSEAIQAPEDLRLRCCNHGNSRDVCPRFPRHEERSSIRFDVVKTEANALELLYVEERDHAPLRWHTIRYLPASETLEPALADACASAQVIAFSRSFLRRFGL